MKATALAASVVLLLGTLVGAAAQPTAFKVRSLFNEGITQVDFYDPSCGVEESGECVVFSLACEGSDLRVSMPGLMENALKFTREGKGYISVDGAKTKLQALEAEADELNGGWVLTAYSRGLTPVSKIAAAKELVVDFGVPVRARLSAEAKAAAKDLSAACSKES